MESSNLVVQDDAHGISAVRDWLIFVTVALGQTLLIVESRYAVTREIEAFPPPDGQWSDNAVIEYFLPLGKLEFCRSRQRPSQKKRVVMLSRHTYGNCVRLVEACRQARHRLRK